MMSGRVRLSRSLLPRSGLRVVGKAGAPEILLGQRVALNHGAHRAVQNQQALAQQFRAGRAISGSRVGSGAGVVAGIAFSETAGKTAYPERNPRQAWPGFGCHLLSTKRGGQNGSWHLVRAGCQDVIGPSPSVFLDSSTTKIRRSANLCHSQRQQQPGQRGDRLGQVETVSGAKENFAGTLAFRKIDYIATALASFLAATSLEHVFSHLNPFL